MKKTIINNASVTATRNVDFFTADRKMSEDVASFFRCILRKKEINLEYDKKIVTLSESIENLDKLAGSIMADQIPALKSAAYEQLKTYETERAKLIEEQAKFDYSESDKAFKKALSKNPSADIVVDEVCKWFANYGLNIENTLFLDEVCGTFGMKIDFRTMVKTEGKAVLKLDANNALKNLYACAYEHMVQAGTIKAAQIPELVREKFMPKKTSKKSKKEKKNA